MVRCKSVKLGCDLDKMRTHLGVSVALQCQLDDGELATYRYILLFKVIGDESESTKFVCKNDKKKSEIAFGVFQTFTHMST